MADAPEQEDPRPQPEPEPEPEPQAESDRKAAATLAELASALAGSAEQGPGDTAVTDPAAVAEQAAREPGRWRMPFGRLGRIDLGRVFDPRPLARTRPGSSPSSSPSSSPRIRRRRGAALLLAAGLILGLAGSTMRPAASTGGPSAGQIGAASPSTAPSSVASTTGPPPAASISSEPSPSASPTPPGPVGPLRKSAAATIRFMGLIVDPIVDSSRTVGSARVFSFTSDGPGSVSAQIVGAAPMSSTVLCLAMDGALVGCDRGASPGMAGLAATAHSVWTVSLISPDPTPPTVDVEFTWPTDHPAITLNHGRFQGFPNSDSLRTLSATFKTRAAGALSLDADWAPTILSATLTLSSLSGTSATPLDTVDYTAQTTISPAYSYKLKADHQYEIDLQNESQDSLRPILTTTISFP